MTSPTQENFNKKCPNWSQKHTKKFSLTKYDVSNRNDDAINVSENNQQTMRETLRLNTGHETMGMGFTPECR
jgi:hypothetical protein